MNERTTCTNCIYRRGITSMTPGYTVCHYLLDTGRVRGCPAESCTCWRASGEKLEQYLLLAELLRGANTIGR